MKEVFSILLALIGIFAVLALTYYLSRWYARRMNTVIAGKHMKLIDRLPVSKNGSLMIVEIAGKQYVAGVSDHNVALMMELEEPIVAEPAENPFGGSFSEAIKRMISGIKDAIGKNKGGPDTGERGVD